MTLELDVEHRAGDFTLAVQVATGAGVTALFGPSGAGKTMLVNLIAGLLRPRRGRIVLDGQVLLDTARGIDLPPRRRRMGYVFQDSRLFPHLSVRHNLLYGRWFTPQAARYAELPAIVALLGLEPLLDRRPRHLSGGERQRVAIGRALLASPRMLLMDEPLAALDAQRRAEILPYVERLRDELALPVIYVSHALDEVVRLAQWLVVLSGGRVAASGPLGTVLGRLDLPPLAGQAEAGAVVEMRVGGSDPAFDLTTLEFPGGALVVPRLDLAAGSAVRVRIRARDVALALDRPERITIRNAIPAVVSEIGPAQGPVVDLALDAGGTRLLARITRQSAAVLGLAPGVPVWALIKSVALDRQSQAPGSTPAEIEL